MTPRNFIGTAEAAMRLNCTSRTVTRYCRRHGLGNRVGRDYVLTDNDVAKLRQLIDAAASGCPAFTKGNQLWRRRMRRSDSDCNY